MVSAKMESKIRCPATQSREYCKSILKDILSDMYSISNDGKVKKYVLRTGDGPTPSDKSAIAINFSIYLEQKARPIYIHNKPYHFYTGSACSKAIDMAIQTMQKGELSLFFFNVDYSCSARDGRFKIPSGPCIFQIELLFFTDIPKVKTFDDKYKEALGIIRTGNELFNYDTAAAIKKFKSAIDILQDSKPNSAEEISKQQDLLVKLFTNLAVCHTKLSNYFLVCKMSNKVFKITKTTNIQVPSKIYFHKARALYNLREYNEAKTILEEALKIYPNNVAINKELENVMGKLYEIRLDKIRKSKILPHTPSE